MKMTIKDDTKLATEQAKYKKHCQFCGHTISFYAFEPDKKLCSWCGKYNYRNGLVEFKTLLEKEREREQNESNRCVE
jgi:rRNA maturation endonuclease Nob1